MPDVFPYAVSLNQIDGWTSKRLFGMNDDIDVGTEAIWPFGGAYAFPDAAETLSVVSSSANDNATGSGVGVVRVVGLDENYESIFENVVLNGVTPVTTTNTFLRVNEAICLTPGSASTTDENAGNITVTNTTSAQTLAYIEAGEGRSHQLIYTVPADKYMLAFKTIFVVGVETGTTKAVKLQLYVRPLGLSWLTQVDTYSVGGQYIGEGSGTIVGPKTDAYAQAIVAANNIPVSAAVHGFLIDKDWYEKYCI